MSPLTQYIPTTCCFHHQCVLVAKWLSPPLINAVQRTKLSYNHRGYIYRGSTVSGALFYNFVSFCFKFVEWISNSLDNRLIASDDKQREV